MSVSRPIWQEIFSAREIARAAGVSLAEARQRLAETDSGVAGEFATLDAAARLVSVLRAPATAERHNRRLFAPARVTTSRRGMPAAASGAFHVSVLAAMVLFTGLGVRSAPAERTAPDPVRLVFVATPGPGGGGGGGGLRQPKPAARSEIKGTSKLRSPVSLPRRPDPKPVKRVETAPAVPTPAPEPAPPPPPAPAAPTPPVVAPVVSSPADTADRAGVPTDRASSDPSHGPGLGGGTGTGTGTGAGAGNGAGIGEGSVAGTGGGPYRPGSGITPPSLLREVKPIYSEEGRRRGVEGDVVMEVVVRSDGTVGAVRVLQGLGVGLDQRAADAVRQWRFAPARRFGTPVDVLVEIAVEFRLR
jgi:periplasmic protein TonB